MGSHSIIARWYERILTTWPFPRSVPGEQQEAYLCDKEPVMRRSAAALLARSRDPAPSLPPPPKGLEAVKAAATAAVRAVDAKLAAVRAAVSGGRVTNQLGSGSAAARDGGSMRRSGSDSELQNRAADDAAASNAAAAVLSILADYGVAASSQSRGRQARRSSCPTLLHASPAVGLEAVGPPADSVGPQSPRQLGVVVVGGGGGAAGQAAPFWPDAGDWAGRLSPLRAVEKRRPWRQWPAPALRHLQPGAVACGGGVDDRGWAGGRAPADWGDDGKSEAGRLSPRRPGPMLAARMGR